MPEEPVVVLTALGVEFTAVKSLFAGETTIRHLGTGEVCHVGTLRGSTTRVVLVYAEKGNTNAAVIADRACREFRSRKLCFTGVAGGLGQKTRLGDVVVARKVYPVHVGKEEPGGFRPRPEPGATSYALRQRAFAVLHDGAWPWGEERGITVHFEPIASADVVLNSRECPLSRQLAQHYGDAVAIEMEGAGITRVGALSDGVQTLVVRGISDHADGDKGAADADGSQERAAAHAAQALARVLMTFTGPADVPSTGAGRQTGPLGHRPAGASAEEQAALVDALMEFSDMAALDFRRGILADMGRLLGLGRRPFPAAEHPMARHHLREIVDRVDSCWDPRKAQRALYMALEQAAPADAALVRLTAVLGDVLAGEED